MTTDHSLTSDELAANLSARDNALIAHGMEMAAKLANSFSRRKEIIGNAHDISQQTRDIALDKMEAAQDIAASIRTLKPDTGGMVVVKRPNQAKYDEICEIVKSVMFSSGSKRRTSEEATVDVVAAMINTKE